MSDLMFHIIDVQNRILIHQVDNILVYHHQCHRIGVVVDRRVIFVVINIRLRSTVEIIDDDCL